MQVLYQGIHSTVYTYKSPDFPQPVALKVLTRASNNHPQLERLRNEFQIGTWLNERNPGPSTFFRKVLATSTWEGKPALILEWIEGLTLAQAFAAKPDLTYLLQLAGSLVHSVAQLHQAGILHQNITPHNVLVRARDQQILLIDFGLASQQDVQISSKDISLFEASLAYLAPEQSGRMHHRVDSRSDLYALGITLYELLTGSPPFEAEDILGMVYAHLARMPAPPVCRPSLQTSSHLDLDGLSRVVLKLLAKNPEDRYQTAQGLLADLNHCQSLLTETGSISTFELAKSDIPEKFQVSERLYGRENELAGILRVFDNITREDGPGRALVMVAGYSGVGKTRLIQEIHKPLLATRGLFMFGGKFDQLQRHIPYAAFIQGLSDLVRALLSESAEVLDNWKLKILAKLGANAQILCEMIPDMKLILGDLPPVPRLEAQETQNRFHQVLQTFIQVMSSPQHPLVLFIDDLQWADAASLKLLTILLKQVQIQGFLVLAAYRENEVDADHPLVHFENELKQQQILLEHIFLRALSQQSIQAFIAETLRCPGPKATELTRLVYEKTQGNAFFVHQFMTALYQDGLLVFEPSLQQWTWDIQLIRTRNVTDNVATLMTEKVRKLPEQSQELLKLAACLGNSFDLKTLSSVLDISLAETLEDLLPALLDGFVLALSDQGPSQSRYRFLHDRVQQAAYAMIPDSWRKPVHLKIGRLLLADALNLGYLPGPSELVLTPGLEEQLFDLMVHFNAGADLIQDQAEKVIVAWLNLWAARKANLSAAFDSAARFTRVGMELLPESAWDTQYELMFSLYLERAEAESMLGHYDIADSLYPQILSHVQTTPDIGRLYYTRLTYYGQQARYAEVIEILLEALALLGEEIPQTEAERELALMQLLAQNQQLMDGKKIMDLAFLPEMQDPEISLKTKLVTAGHDSVSGSGLTYLFALLSAKVIHWALCDGNSEGMILSYVFYARVVREHLGDFQASRELAEVALQLAKRYNSPSQTCKIYTGLAAVVCYFWEPLKDTLRYYHQSNQIILQSSGWVYTAYNAFFIGMTSLVSGLSLKEVLQDTIKSLHFLNPFKSSKVRQDMLFQLVLQPVLHLTGESPPDAEWILPATEFQTRYAAQNLILGNFYFTRMMLAYLFEDFDSAQTLLSPTLEQACLKLPYVYGTESCFYVALICLHLIPTASKEQQAYLSEQVKGIQQHFQVWADVGEVNFRAKFLLITAEWAKIRGNYWEAVQSYERAERLAREQEWWSLVGLINQVAGRFYLQSGQTRLAALCFHEALGAYETWGATALVNHLRAKHALVLQERDLVPTPRPHPPEPFQLDVLSLIKSSQALSSEVELVPLLQKLLKIVMENAGAQKAALLQIDGDQCFLEALAVGEQIRCDRLRLDETSEIAHSVVNYVLRTQQSVLLADATQAAGFSQDSYVLRHQTKSLLCLPLLNQGKLNGVLYLENNLARAAFQDEHVQILNLLATQAAISLENTRLYQKMRQQNQILEARVQERTAQLSQANQAKSRFLANISHEIRTPLNAIIGFSRLLQESPERDPESRGQLQIILQSGDHLLKLINNVLEMSKVEAGNLTVLEDDFDLAALVTEIKGMMGLRAQAKQLELHCEIGGDVPRWIRTDEKILRQLLINFLTNAIKYTETGSVSLLVSKLGTDSDLRLAFQISDTGIGISASALTQIFQPFVQIEAQHRVREGVGLGLSISQHLIETLGGKLRVESQPGQGSLFCFELPVQWPQKSLSDFSQVTRKAIGIKTGQSSRILIADDDPNNRLLLAHYLQPLGFELQFAANGLEALSSSEQWHPHLILMDMRMPVLDGYAATRRIKAQSMAASSPVIVAVTASAFEEEREKVLAAGCDAFLRKPVKVEEVLATISDWLGVEYLYQEPDQESPAAQLNISAWLSTIPPILLNQLKEATELGHMQRISQMIHQISQLSEPLGQCLHDLSEQFDYGGILNMLEQAPWFSEKGIPAEDVLYPDS